jgi:phosphoenolpyruvate phosphomutase
VPTSFNQVTEEELASHGVNIVIYANHLLRAAYPAMKKCAERILECERAQEASAELCMPIKEIISLI